MNNSFSPITSKTPLNINVLFFYSPETLKSYINMKQLIEDNNDYCFILADILNHNIVKYKTTVTNVGNILFEDMQKGRWGMTRRTVRKLVRDYAKGVYPVLIRLQVHYKANLVVFLPMLRENAFFFGTSATIGFKTPFEACVAIARGEKLKGKKTSTTYPILLPHEFGHILGCYHDLLDGYPPNPDRVPAYAHKAVDAQGKIMFGTIMVSKISTDKQILYYSNSNLFRYPSPVQNTPCGVAGISENYKIIEKNLPRLAATFSDDEIFTSR